MNQPCICIYPLHLGQYGALSRVPCAVQQGSLTPGPWTGTGQWPVRNRAAQQEVSGRQASEGSSAAPQRSHYHLSRLPPPPPPPAPATRLYVEKLSSTKPVPGAKKVGDRCYTVCSHQLSIHSIDSVYVSIPISQFLPPHPFPLWYPYTYSLCV